MLTVARLEVPLGTQQIEAANRLHSRLKQWEDADKAFMLLREQVPGFEVASCVLKAAAVNQLYGTNVFAISRMARHIAEVMKAPPAEPNDLILALSTLKHNGSTRTHTSFAAKFAHFFVDPQSYLIYDSYAEKMVKLHLGWRNCLSDKGHPYRAFVINVGRLRDVAGLDCTAVELDRYLWLAGLSREWRAKGAKAQINAEVLQLLETSLKGGDPDVDVLLAAIPGNLP